jgi:hypothetical protein
MTQTMNPVIKATIARPPMTPNAIATVGLVAPVVDDALLVALAVSTLLLLLVAKEEEEEEGEEEGEEEEGEEELVLAGKSKVAKNSSEPVPPE